MNREQRRAAARNNLVLPNGAPVQSRPTVGVGLCHAGDHTYPLFHRSLRHVFVYDRARKEAPWIVNDYDCEASGVHVPDVRCDIVRMFLADPAQPEWLWLTDDDATFPPYHLDLLIDAADPAERPIMGSLAFGVAPRRDEEGNEHFNEVIATEWDLFPTIYYFDEEGNTGQWFDYPRDAIIPVHSTGCHSFVAHRSVLEDERWHEGNHPNPWFRTVPNHRTGRMMSEDQFFFIRAGQLGYPTHINTGARTGHIKTYIADEDLFLRQQATRLATEAIEPQDVEAIDPDSAAAGAALAEVDGAS